MSDLEFEHIMLEVARIVTHSVSPGKVEFGLRDSEDKDILIYIPLRGPHAGAMLEKLLADGRVITVYELHPGYYELSISMSPMSDDKDEVWEYTSSNSLLKAVASWSGKGEPTGAYRRRK